MLYVQWCALELLNKLVEMLMLNQVWGGRLRTCISNKTPGDESGN